MKYALMNKIDDNRKSLLGVAVILILCVHSISIIDMPKIVRSVMGIGSAGIYIFAFLSGRGLYFSLNSGKYTKTIEFYRRRFSRIMIPYLLISIVWYGIKWLILSFKPLDFLYDLSTISFWVSHRGAWYVAFLIPVYLLYPLFYKWVSTSNTIIKCISVISLILAFLLFLNINLHDLYSHFSQIAWSLISVVLGVCSTEIDTDSLFCNVLVFGVGLLSGLALWIGNEFINGIAMINLGLLIVVFMAKVLTSNISRYFKKPLEKLGEISLEMYLWNIYLLQAFTLIDNVNLLSANTLVIYVLIVIFGILLSLMSSKFEHVIMNSLTR